MSHQRKDVREEEEVDAKVCEFEGDFFENLGALPIQIICHHLVADRGSLINFVATCKIVHEACHAIGWQFFYQPEIAKPQPSCPQSTWIRLETWRPDAQEEGNIDMNLAPMWSKYGFKFALSTKKQMMSIHKNKKKLMKIVWVGDGIENLQPFGGFYGIDFSQAPYVNVHDIYLLNKVRELNLSSHVQNIPATPAQPLVNLRSIVAYGSNFVNADLFPNVLCADFSSCTQLADVSALQNARYVALPRCAALNDVSPLVNVTYLDVSYCNLIATIPFSLEHLAHLDAANCTGLTEIKDLQSLRVADLHSCANLTTVKNLPLLEDLNVEQATSLEVVKNTPVLKTLQAKGCTALRWLPPGIRTAKLEGVNIKYTLTPATISYAHLTIPTLVHNLLQPSETSQQQQQQQQQQCKREPANKLKVLCLSGGSIADSFDSENHFFTALAQWAPFLTDLSMRTCSGLVTIELNLANFQNLTSISLYSCTGIRRLNITNSSTSSPGKREGPHARNNKDNHDDNDDDNDNGDGDQHRDQGQDQDQDGGEQHSRKLLSVDISSANELEYVHIDGVNMKTLTLQTYHLRDVHVTGYVHNLSVRQYNHDHIQSVAVDGGVRDSVFLNGCFVKVGTLMKSIHTCNKDRDEVFLNWEP